MIKYNSTQNKWLAMALLALMAGPACSIMPGSHIKAGEAESRWFNGAAAEHEEAEAQIGDEVRIKPVNSITGLPVVHELAPELADSLDSEGMYEYVVGPGDVLNVTVWDHPELTIPAGGERKPSDAGNWVHPDGTIFYPYVGVVEVAGRNLREIRQLITKRLGRYIEDPQVDVSVAAFRSQKVYVSGGVNQPGAYPLTNVPLRLLDVVNQAGGVSEQADWRNVILTRDGKEYRLSLKEIYEKGDKRFNVLLKSDDVVHVSHSEDQKVFVMGEVNKPASLSMGRNGITLAEALAESGGINEMQANATGIFVMRRAEEEGGRFIDLYQLNAKDATAFVLADEFNLQERDIVYVTAAPIARWNRVISQIMPTIQAVYYGARSAYEVDRLED